MKKIIGIILLVVVGLNLISIMVRAAKGDPIGSPAYLILLVMMSFGAYALINSTSKKNQESADLKKKDDE